MAVRSRRENVPFAAVLDAATKTRGCLQNRRLSSKACIGVAGFLLFSVCYTRLPNGMTSWAVLPTR